MTTNQEGVHAAVRAVTGTSRSYNEDWHALFDAEGITAGTFNERMLGWINATLSASYTNLNEAMQAFAVEQGFANWASMNTFVAGSEAATFLRTYGPYGMVMNFADDASIKITDEAGLLDFSSSGQVSGGALVGPGAKTTYSAPSPKLTEQADGALKFQAHNLFLWSEDFSQATWTKANCTATAGEITVASAGSLQKYVQQAGLTTAAFDWRGSFELKQVSGIRYIQLLKLGSVNNYVNFDLQAGTVGSAGSACVGSIELLPDGYYRCTVDVTNATTHSDSWRVQIVNSTTAAYNDPSTASGSVLIRKAHFRRQNSQPDYIATTTAAAYDLPYVYSSGVRTGVVVEPAATNHALYSQTFTNAVWTPRNLTNLTTTTTGPNGLAGSAVLLNETTTNGVHDIQQSHTQVTTSQIVGYAIVKAGPGRTRVTLSLADITNNLYSNCAFDLSGGQTSALTSSGSGPLTGASARITPLANEWWLCEITGTPGASHNTTNLYIQNDNGSGTAAPSVSYAGTVGNGVYVYHAQSEIGTVATSPIITYGSTVLRAADTEVVPTSVFPLGTEHTIFVHVKAPLQSGLTVFALNLSDGTVTEMINIRHNNGSQKTSGAITDGGASQSSMPSVANTPDNVSYKAALAVALNDAAYCLGGAAVVPGDGSITLPTVTGLRLGQSVAGTNTLNGLICRVAYFPRRFSDAELQAVTA